MQPSHSSIFRISFFLISFFLFIQCETTPDAEDNIEPKEEINNEANTPVVSIEGDNFLINGKPTFEGRTWMEDSLFVSV